MRVASPRSLRVSRRRRGVAVPLRQRRSRRSKRRGGAGARRASWTRMRRICRPTPMWSRSEATARSLLEPLGVSIPVYPLKGYSITLPLGPEHAEAAPTVSLTDEAHKIVISRLGNRLRAAGTAELAGYDTAVSPVRCAAIARRVGEPVSRHCAASRATRAGPGCARRRRATCRSSGGTRLSQPLPQYRPRHARLDARLRLGQGARRPRQRAASPQVDFRFAH